MTRPLLEFLMSLSQIVGFALLIIVLISLVMEQDKLKRRVADLEADLQYYLQPKQPKEFSRDWPPPPPPPPPPELSVLVSEKTGKPWRPKRRAL